MEIFNTIYNLLPEITLALTIFLLTLISPINKLKIPEFILPLSAIVISISFILIEIFSPPKINFSGLFIIDNFSSSLKLFILFFSVNLTIIFRKEMTREMITPFMLLNLGALCSVSSANIYFTFTSVEIVSISIYLILSKNTQLTLKYYVYSAVSSGILLYGLTLLHGLGGSPDYSSISRYFSENEINPLTLSISLILIFAGLGFKMGLFPFNSILPQIFEKIPLKKAVTIAALPVLAISGLMVRLLLSIFHDGASFITSNDTYQLLKIVKWQNIIAIISSASILAGSFIILWQTNLNKIFAYIIISLAGGILLPFSACNELGNTAIVLNILHFIIVAVGFTLILKIIQPAEKETTQVDLIGIWFKSPLICITVVILLASVAGIPLTYGFIVKLFSYSVIFTAGYEAAGIISMLATLPLLYFTFRIVISMFTKSGKDPVIKLELTDKIILLILLFLVVSLGIFSSQIIELSKHSIKII